MFLILGRESLSLHQILMEGTQDPPLGSDQKKPLDRGALCQIFILN